MFCFQNHRHSYLCIDVGVCNVGDVCCCRCFRNNGLLGGVLVGVDNRWFDCIGDVAERCE